MLHFMRLKSGQWRCGCLLARWHLNPGIHHCIVPLDGFIVMIDDEPADHSLYVGHILAVV